jgi:type II secretory pathway component PulF
VLLTFVLPRLVQMFPGGREQLPGSTRFLLGVSDFLLANGLVLGVAAVASAVAAVWFVRTPRGRYGLHAALLKIPRLGRLLRQIATSRFASTAAVLQSAGCDVITMLDTAARSSGNAVLEASFARVAAGVQRGASISDGLAAEKGVDPLLEQLVAVGEKTGKLEHCLKEVVAYYDEEIPRAVKRALALLEPVLLLGAGLAVGFIVFAAISPIFRMYESL